MRKSKRYEVSLSVAKEVAYDYSKRKKLTKDALIQSSLNNHGYSFKKLSNIYVIEEHYFVRNDIPETTSIPAYYATSGNKLITNQLLKKMNINVPMCYEVKSHDYESALKIFHSIDSKVVLKPVKTDLGKDIFLNIESEKSFESSWQKLAKKYRTILIEKMLKGKDYRLLVIAGKFKAATQREPFYIVGNGEKTIQSLIEMHNEKRSHHPYVSVRKKISFDEEMQRKLDSSYLNLDTVLPKNQKVYLKDLPNIAQGGEHTDITLEVHSEFKSIVETVFNNFPPSGYLGFDIIAEDITKSPHTQEWGIIEIDAHACLMHHQLPVYGKPRDVISPMIEETLRHPKCINNKPLVDYAVIYDEPYELFTIGYAVHKQLLQKAAWSRNLKVQKFNSKFWSIEDDQNVHYFIDNMSDQTAQITRWMTNGKYTTKLLLNAKELSTPKGEIFQSDMVDKAWEYAKTLNKPVVVKPLSGSGGKGVVTNIQDRQTFFEAIEHHDLKRFIVEEHIKGFDYRLLVIAGQYVAACKRIPAHVKGNGISTLSQLIEEKNKLRKHNPHLGKSLLSIAPLIKKQLEKKGIDENSVIKNEEIIYLQDVANVGAGGENIDITQSVHPDFQKIAVDAWNAFPSLHYCGLDIQVQDITQPASQQEWAIIEVNANADIGFHHFPSHGAKRDVASKLIDSLFPDAIIKAIETQHKRVELHIIGKVKNVGYRNWLKKKAFLMNIECISRNEGQDKIIAVIEGMPNAINYLIELCYIGTKQCRIDSIITKPLVIEDQKSFQKVVYD